MKDEKKFMNPEAELITFKADDVILTSIIGQIGEGEVDEGEE